MCAEILESASVDVDTNLFELGMSSVQLVRMQRHISDTFDIDLSIVEIFDNPTVRLLAGQVAQARAGLSPSGPTSGLDQGTRQRHRQRRRARLRETPSVPADDQRPAPPESEQATS